MLNFILNMFMSKRIATSARIRFGYSHGRADSSSPREWSRE